MAPKEYSCVKRTKKAFENSLTELSKQFPFNKITVKMLCDKAELSRNAFYFHYKDINDLLRSIEEDVVEEIVALLKTIEQVDFPENVFVSVESLINIFDERRDTVLMLFDKNYSVSFTTKVSKIYSDFNYRYFCRFHSNDKKIKYDFFYMFLSSGFYGILRHWLENPGLMTKEELVKLTYTLIKRLLVKDNPNIIDIISM
ncbi:MAG: TetR/AcrR family transcriptional regulator [Clostridia bacterium]|nr:TetR/AcrR family transcriptional regulator [Clostridia bacterium]MBR2079819.1 TetR/AcrR family transcriptional regulator [Clostridia bacterium]MBR2417923.1 TetR/AcrR family transcriptional regulator [Clostridia bacterium]